MEEKFKYPKISDQNISQTLPKVLPRIANIANIASSLQNEEKLPYK